MSAVKRQRTVVGDGSLALRIGDRIRSARLNAGLTQQQLADGRYTKSYISALEKGHAKPSMAALSFIAQRLALPPAQFLAGDDVRWTRLEADLLLASGRWQEAVDAYEAMSPTSTERSIRAEVLRGQAEALCRLGRGVEAIGPATEAVALFMALGREADAALAGYWLANALYLEENTAEARSILRAWLDRIRGGLQVDPDLQMRMLTAIAYVETWDGDHAAAVTYLEEARALSIDLDDRRRAAFLSALALAHQESGNLEYAISTGIESLALFRAADASHEAALLENNLANAYLAVGNLARARELAVDARRQYERINDDRELARVLDTEARISLAGGEVEKAVGLAKRAVAVARAVDNRKAMADALLTLARAAVAAKETELITNSYERAARLLRRHGPRMRLQQVLGEWAEVLAGTGQHEQAYQLMREALRYSADAGSAVEERDGGLATTG